MCVCMRVSACVYICMGYIPYIRFPNITALESGQFQSLCVRIYIFTQKHSEKSEKRLDNQFKNGKRFKLTTL